MRAMTEALIRKTRLWAYVTNRPVTVGYAGNMVVLLPNGATFYIFGDDREFPWTESVHEVSQLAPVCWQ